MATATKTKTAPKTAKPVKRKSALPVYFAGNNIGVLPIESATYNIYSIGNQTKREAVYGLTLEFGNRGVTQGYDAVRDAEKIAAIRDWIANSDDFRVRKYQIREVKPNAPRAPSPKWDNLNAKTIVEFVKTGGLDIDECIKYEQYGGNCRDDVIDALEALRDNDDPGLDGFSELEPEL